MTQMRGEGARAPVGASRQRVMLLRQRMCPVDAAVLWERGEEKRRIRG